MLGSGMSNKDNRTSLVTKVSVISLCIALLLAFPGIAISIAEGFFGLAKLVFWWLVGLALIAAVCMPLGLYQNRCTRKKRNEADR